ncbi:MAG TPA: DUF2393 family protein [Terriglobales bacterium]|jgi:hypothetical protein|nr:DUF2393 family protein [Terriglobales bacterium]
MAEPEPVLQPAPEPESETPWKAIGIGVALMAVVVGGVILLGRKSSTPVSSTLDPYSSSLQFSDLHMQVAQNFAGGRVRYLDGIVTNTGSRTVTHITVQIVFRNSLGEVVDKPTEPLRSLVNRGPYDDMEDVEARPLRPQETREFRLVFEHVSQDWNRQFPELQVVGVRFQ